MMATDLLYLYQQVRETALITTLTGSQPATKETTTMITANINPKYAHMSEAEMAANQRMLTEAKAAQADPRAGRKRGQLNAFYWRTEADFGGSVCELHHHNLTAAMESYGYADQRGVPVILSAVINDVPYVAKANVGSTVAPPWMQVLVSDTSHIERVEARKARA